MDKIFDNLYKKFGANFFLTTFLVTLFSWLYTLYLLNECKESSIGREKEFTEKIEHSSKNEIEYLKSQKNRIDSIYFFEKSRK